MRIVHLLFSFTTGGAELLVADMANYQSANNQVWIIILNDHIDSYLLGLLSHDVKVIRINRKEGSPDITKIVKLFYKLWQIRADIIHCHHESMIKLLPVIQTKKVITIHDVGRNLTGVEKYDVKAAISQSVDMDVRYRSNNKIRPIIIENGIDDSQVKNNQAFSITGGIRLIQVGRLLHEKKGQDILIKAVHLLITQYQITNIKLTFVGSGPSLNYLQSLLKDLGLVDIVLFAGLQDRKWIYDNLKDFSMLVQPSRFEGFGLTVVEGMLAKIPCLVSDIDGPIDLIENGEYGFAFKSGDAESCAEVLHKIINYNRMALNEKVQKAYMHAINKYSSKTMNEKYIEAYLN